VATLTYNYAESTAVVGPLAVEREPHSWDLCASHALRISTPRGWNLVRHPDLSVGDDPDLTALLDAVIDPGAPTANRSDSDPEWLRRLKARQKPGKGARAKAAQASADTGAEAEAGAEGQRSRRRGHLRVVDPDE